MHDGAVRLHARSIKRAALDGSEQPAQKASEAGHYTLEQSNDTGQQTADGTTKTPQHAHRSIANLGSRAVERLALLRPFDRGPQEGFPTPHHP
jgi:hypothetical protein